MGERWERVGDGERHWKAEKARNAGVVSQLVIAWSLKRIRMWIF